MQQSKFIVSPKSNLQGEVKIIGDKSISHRSLMLSAIAEGTSKISGILMSDDVIATQNAMRQMGVNIKEEILPTGEAVLLVQGVGLYGLKPPNNDLYMGNSGTAMRLLSGLLAGQNFNWRLTGDTSLSRRPMLRISKVLQSMGANISTSETGTAPITAKANSSPLKSINYQMPIASAQVKSAILLAGMYASGTTQIIETQVTRDHTEKMLQLLGCQIQIAELAEGQKQISLIGGQQLQAREIHIAGDISSAAFLFVGAVIGLNSNVLVKNVGINPTRTGILDILQKMGARLELTKRKFLGNEEIADIWAQSSQLQAIEIGAEEVALMIDELPIFFIAAACATGVSKIRGAEELRVKESDRLASMAEGLTSLGIQVQLYPDGIDIYGKGESDEVFTGGIIESFNDHRIAMSFAIASLRATSQIYINNTQLVATSFPNFTATLHQLGLKINN